MKDQLVKRLLPILGILMLCSCAARDVYVEQILAYWMGHTQAELVSSWGPPTFIWRAGEPGIWTERIDNGPIRMLVYVLDQGTSQPIPADYLGTESMPDVIGTLGRPPEEFKLNPPKVHTDTAVRMFWIDRNGKVVRSSWQGP